MRDLRMVVGSDERVVKVACAPLSRTICEAIGYPMLLLLCPIMWPAVPFIWIMPVVNHRKPRAILTDTWFHVPRGSIPLSDVVSVEYASEWYSPNQQVLKVRGGGSAFRLSGVKDLDEFVRDLRRLVDESRRISR